MNPYRVYEPALTCAQRNAFHDGCTVPHCTVTLLLCMQGSVYSCADPAPTTLGSVDKTTVTQSVTFASLTSTDYTGHSIACLLIVWLLFDLSKILPVLPAHQQATCTQAGVHVVPRSVCSESRPLHAPFPGRSAKERDRVCLSRCP